MSIGNGHSLFCECEACRDEEQMIPKSQTNAPAQQPAEPIGWCPWHPERGYAIPSIRKKQHSCERHIRECGMTGWEAKPVYGAAQPPAAPVETRDRKLLATLVYEAMRFSIWAAGQGIMPDEGEPAQGPEDFLYEYSCALEIDDWEGLAEVARDAVLEAVSHSSAETGGDK